MYALFHFLLFIISNISVLISVVSFFLPFVRSLKDLFNCACADL